MGIDYEGQLVERKIRSLQIKKIKVSLCFPKNIFLSYKTIVAKRLHEIRAFLTFPRSTQIV